MREEKGAKPVILKLGLALALSFAGFIYSRLRTRRIKPNRTLPPGRPRPSGHGSQINLGGGIGAALGTCNTVSEGNYSCAQEETRINTNRVISNHSPDGLSPSSKQYGEKEEFLLPEFHDLVKNVDFGDTIDAYSLNKDEEEPRTKVRSSVAFASPEKDDYEQEVRQLRNMIGMLQGREQSLEVQLLEYCGLREQETAAMELRNRLKISNMEAKMLSLKVRTLQSEKARLEEQVADHAKVLAELDAGKAKVKLLERKLRHEAEQNREQIIRLKQRVAKLQEQECKAVACDGDIQTKLQKLEDLEFEVQELRKSNSRLQIENSELAQRLDSTQILANSVLENTEAGVLKKHEERLRQENERLMNEIEQLQADRSSDVEELVYMRWINACLRYELRNYQPPPGKTVAKDLSRSLSPTSEKKAKQLILEYANTDGEGNIVGFDLDQWSSSQASFLTDCGECDDSSIDNSSVARTNTTGKTTFFNKLRRLLHGKDSHHHHSQVSSQAKFGTQEDSYSPHFWLSKSTGNDASADSLRSEFAALTATSRASFDFSMLTSMKERDRRNSDSVVMGSSTKFSPREGASNSDSLGIGKANLEKYAKALKDSSASARHQRRIRSASYS